MSHLPPSETFIGLCHVFFPHFRLGGLRDETKECLSESRLISYLLSNVH